MSQYITDIAPYFAQQDQQNQNPVFQNAGAQQSYMNQQLAQGNQYAQPTSHGNKFAGLSPLAMAAMLRKKDPYEQAQQAIDKYGAENVYGFGGQGQTPTSWNGEP
jgi:hypothetical protein